MQGPGKGVEVHGSGTVSVPARRDSWRWERGTWSGERVQGSRFSGQAVSSRPLDPSTPRPLGPFPPTRQLRHGPEVHQGGYGSLLLRSGGRVGLPSLYDTLHDGHRAPVTMAKAHVSHFWSIFTAATRMA